MVQALRKWFVHIGWYGGTAVGLMLLGVAFMWLAPVRDPFVRGGIALTVLAVALGLASMRAQGIAAAATAQVELSEESVERIAKAVTDELEARMRPLAHTMVFKPDESPRTTDTPTPQPSDAASAGPGTGRSGA